MLAADRKACFFKGVTISPAEWHAVEMTNKILKVNSIFYILLHLLIHLIFVACRRLLMRLPEWKAMAQLGVLSWPNTNV